MLKKTLSKTTLLLTFFLTLFLVAGCTSSSQNDVSGHNNQGETQEEKIEQNSLQTKYPLVYTDDSAVETTLEKEPQRIVCLAPPSTEILSALGLDDRLVGLTAYDTYPEGIQEKAELVFEDSLNPNIEQLLQLNPDLIVTSMHDPDLVKSLRDLGLAVAHLNPQSLETTYETIEKLGVITNTQGKAQEIVQGLKDKEKAIADKVNSIPEEERVTVWLEVDPALYTAGGGTFLDELITKAGGKNIAGDVEGWTQFNEEQIIAKNPQVILGSYSYYLTENIKSNVQARPGWENIDAVKNNRIYDVDSDRVTRSGPRIVDGLEEIAQCLYPDLF